MPFDPPSLTSAEQPESSQCTRFRQPVVCAPRNTAVFEESVARREAKEVRNCTPWTADAFPEALLRHLDSIERSGAGVEPTQPWVTRPHRF